MITERMRVRRPWWQEWSQRRRWLLAVLVMITFLCGGLGVAVPAVLLLDYTDRQGDPPATPIEAADLYLIQLDQGEEIGLWRALVESQRDKLVDQWRELKATIERTQPPPDKLGWSTFDVANQGDDEAAVTVPVEATWWGKGGMSMVGEEHPWRFSMQREDGGWRIARVEPFAWCGGHVQADACS